jgi:hypothetical protein
MLLGAEAVKVARAYRICLVPAGMFGEEPDAFLDPSQRDAMEAALIAFCRLGSVYIRQCGCALFAAGSRFRQNDRD